MNSFRIGNREIREVSSAEADAIIDRREPRGRFIVKEDSGGYTAIDNSDGSAWCEEFKNRNVALAWLAVDYLDFELAHEIDDALASMERMA